jgi:AAA15 family ATPase/GTPase
MEAQGTVRLLDILPAFLELEDPSVRPVYIIDELDRSWHYMLSKKLLGIYLRGCTKDSRCQLLFSTHDLMLMDQNLFRRSEMFLTERSQEGVSSVFSLNMPGLRYDKDIRKMYLQGALGGIPCLRHYGALND